MNLLDLPSDILEHITLSSDVRAILACKLVCKALRNAIATSLPIRYKLALAVHGMRDGLKRAESLAEKLEKLERYGLAWHELAWTPSMRIDLPNPSMHVHQADGYLLIIDPTTSAVRVIRLPSPLRGVEYEEYTWTAPSGFVEGNGVRDVLIDRRHDLVLFLRETDDWNRLSSVCALSLSTGSPHPFAENGITTIQIIHHGGWLRYTPGEFELRGRFLISSASSSTVHKPNYRPSVYDWTRGGREITPEYVLNSVRMVTFLDDTRALVLAMPKRAKDVQEELTVVDLTCLDSDGRATVTHNFECPFPLPPASQASVMNTFTHYPVCEGRAKYDHLFEDDGWTMLHLTFYTLTDEEHVLRVPISVLQSHTDNVKPHNGDPPVTIPYDKWSMGTTLDESSALLPPQTDSTRGARLYQHEADRPSSPSMHVYDFRHAGAQQFREKTFTIPFDSLDTGRTACLRVSGDCLVSKEYIASERGWGDDYGPIRTITVYSLE